MQITNILNKVLPADYAECEKLYASLSANNLQSLAICAPEHGQGVSTIAYSLARRVAIGGARTLLVDCQTDKRYCSLAKSLGIGETEWHLDAMPEDLSATPATLGNTGVDIVSFPENPRLIRCLREDRQLRALTSYWATQYDLVLFDLPPVLQKNKGNIAAETLAACCDSTWLLLQSGRVSEATLTDTVTILEKAGANLAAIVMNDQHAPSLAKELARETYRLEKFLPGLMAKLRGWILSRAFLNQEI